MKCVRDYFHQFLIKLLTQILDLFISLETSELDQYVGSNLEMSKCQFCQQYPVVTALISIETKLSKGVIIWVKIVAAMKNIYNSVGNQHMILT